MDKIRINNISKVDNSYDIVFGNDLFSEIADGLHKLNIGKVSIITDSTVKDHHGNKLLSLLKKQGLDALMISFNAGEGNKNRQSKEQIEDVLLKNKFSTTSVLIALGGGVVAEMTGFIAATYMRGIPYLLIPTTLRAMIDNSIGGRAGVNTTFGKNDVGVTYHPKRVFIDTSVLKTLSNKEVKKGTIDMIQQAIMADKDFFVYLEDYHEKISSLDETILLKAIQKSCSIKKEIIETDASLLKFGNAIGKAIEKCSNYKIKHSEVLALGMVAETKIAEEINLLDSINSNKIMHLIKKTGELQNISKLSIDKIIEYTNKSYILPKSIGEVTSVKVSDEVVSKVLQNMNKK